jgi:hypothetical protein
MTEMAQTQEKNRAAMQGAQQALISQLSPDQQKTFQAKHRKHQDHDRGDKKAKREGCKH